MESDLHTTLCGHCGNSAPHSVLLRHECVMPLTVPDGTVEKYPYRFTVLACSTCGAIELNGGFEGDDVQALYPRGANFLPDIAQMGDDPPPVPFEVLDVYGPAWRLRFLAPDAFAVQVRKALEIVCGDLEARGNSLHERLRDLASRGLLPEGLVGVTELIREVGNVGAHQPPKAVDRNDAELLDELFRLLLSYLYVGPRLMSYLTDRPWRWQG